MTRTHADPPRRFMSLYAANQRRIYGFLRALAHDPADTDDLVQQTLEVMWSKFGEFATRELADPTKQTETILALSADSREDVDAFADEPRLCAVIKPDLLEFWRLYEPRYEIPNRPLVRFIQDDFRVIHEYSGYNLAVPR